MQEKAKRNRCLFVKLGRFDDLNQIVNEAKKTLVLLSANQYLALRSESVKQTFVYKYYPSHPF